MDFALVVAFGGMEKDGAVLIGGELVGIFKRFFFGVEDFYIAGIVANML